ncbi:hypothetical protein BpHYR1_002800 [Brachionus plicatilis]|uniref:Uncharacterized protein n=1 Tax=Brachionus plicatilis TaxID=10195 RepID=A0A3M7Q048_BRAPC|nr:hypothetical protein BpHYR1_002800 [Brachionus plicatilis]
MSCSRAKTEALKSLDFSKPTKLFIQLKYLNDILITYSGSNKNVTQAIRPADQRSECKKFFNFLSALDTLSEKKKECFNKSEENY